MPSACCASAIRSRSDCCATASRARSPRWSPSAAKPNAANAADIHHGPGGGGSRRCARRRRRAGALGVRTAVPRRQAGLRSNDLIVGVGRTPVSSIKTLSRGRQGGEPADAQRAARLVRAAHPDTLMLMKPLSICILGGTGFLGTRLIARSDQGRPSGDGAVARPGAAQAPAGAAGPHAGELRRLRRGAALASVCAARTWWSTWSAS